jgi:hypothetical protein
MEDDNDIDKLFRQGLKDPEIPFNELDWEGMERKLDANKPKRIVPAWIIIAGSIAALLIVFMFWFFFRLNQEVAKDKPDAFTNKKVLPSGSDSSASQVPPQKELHNPEKGQLESENEQPNSQKELLNSRKELLSSRKELYNPAKELLNRGEEPLNSQIQTLPQVELQKGSSVNVQKEVIVKDKFDLKQSEVAVTRQKVTDKAIDGRSTDGKPPVENSIALSAQDKSSVPATGKSVTDKNSDYNKLETSIRRKMEASFNKKRGFTLSLMAAPDVTTTQSSKASKISSNVGMLVTYALNNKISVTSGAVYSKKFYNSVGNYSQSNSYTSKPFEVDADCNVIDIPLNVNYKIFHKKNIAVSVNTGLSSYLMLKERYNYITGEAGTVQQTSTLEIRNQNQHIFGIANVSISVDRKITPSVSIGIQPFMKIPLTGIGNGNVDLKSTGLSFSVNIGLFPGRKQEKNALNKY